jgi:hypothetical protein
VTLDEVIEASPVAILDDEYHVSRVDHFPPDGDCFAAISDGTEITLIASSGHPAIAASSEREGPFRALRLEVAVPFGAPGFVAAATTALAQAGVNVFLISTFSFDYVLVKAHDVDAALGALGDRGFPIA